MQLARISLTLSLSLSLSLSLAMRLYHLSLPVSLLDDILFPYKVVVDKFVLLIQHLHVRLKGSIGECCLWVRPYFSSCVLRVSSVFVVFFVFVFFWMDLKIDGRYPYSYYEGHEKVLCITQTLDLSHTVFLCTSFTYTEINTEIWIRSSSFITRASGRPEQKYSSTALLSWWSLEFFLTNFIYIYIYIYIHFLGHCIYIYIYIYM